MSAYYNSTGNCTNGEGNASYPDQGHEVLINKTFVAIEGNDTSFTPFSDCCVRPVGFIPPCTLWCEEDSTGPSMHKCWDEHGFHPYASWGATTGPMPERASMPVIIGAVLGSIAFLAVAAGSWLWWLGKRSVRPKENNSTGRRGESIKLGSTVPPAYETLKYDLIPKMGEEVTKYNIIVKQTDTPSTSTGSRTRLDSGDTQSRSANPE